MLYRNTQKPKLNLAELAYVTAKVPAPLRRRLPLPVLENHLYGLAIENENLIEEVEAVYLHEEERRRFAPAMTINR